MPQNKSGELLMIPSNAQLRISVKNALLMHAKEQDNYDHYNSPFPEDTPGRHWSIYYDALYGEITIDSSNAPCPCSSITSNATYQVVK